MLRSGTVIRIILVSLAAVMFVVAPATAQGDDITGLWYCYASEVDGWLNSDYNWTFYYGSDLALYALINIPDLGYLDEVVPVLFDGQTVTVIIEPGVFEMTGEYDGEFITGETYVPVPFPPYLVLMSWISVRFTGEIGYPGEAPGPVCENLPPKYCTGSAAECSEIVPFTPDEGPGYLDYPINGETWDNQYRSFIRRDNMLNVQNAADKVHCKTDGWDYGNFAPLGLGDMSEADGSIPGTSVGNPGHPPGTHEDGKDIDIAYSQLYVPDNPLRTICLHHEGITDAYHCVEAPYGFDRWRVALFIAYLAEHPRMRAIGVDGQAGLVLEEALDDLVLLGWLDADARAAIPLAYEVVDQGYGWFLFHHHHMHVSMNPVSLIVAEFLLEPTAVSAVGPGRFVTGYLEFASDSGVDGDDVDVATVALVVNGHTLLPAESTVVSDYNGNGIPDITAQFDRKKIVQLNGGGVFEMAIIGSTFGPGRTFFQESETVFIISSWSPAP